MSRITIAFIILLTSHLAVHAQRWEAQTSGTANLLQGVWFTTAERGFVVGDLGTVLQTENGGATWSPLALTDGDLLDVAFRNESVGLIVGDSGRVFRTVDGGDTWAQVPSGTDRNLAGVAFGAGGLAYAAGRDGTIIRSTNSGATWTVAETGADRYRSVAAAGGRAWAVGNGGVIRATVDGGLTWSSLSSGTVSDLHAAWFVSTQEGWIAGQNNTLLYTSDGGTSWAPRSSSIGVGLNAVFFGNSSLGWTAGRTGNAFRSTNGAAAWTNEPTPTMEHLNDLHFADAFNGWAVGDNGTILVRHVPRVSISLHGDTIEWDPLAGEFQYDVVRGDLGPLRVSPGGSFMNATRQCIAENLTTASTLFAPRPIPGEAFWFLVRVVTTQENGTYDSGSFRQLQGRDAGIALSLVDCF